MRVGKRWMAWCAIVAVAAMVATACGSDDGDKGATAASSTTAPKAVSVQFPFNSFPGSLSLLRDVIRANRLEAKHGITLQDRLYATTDEPQQALASGSLDVGYFSLGAWAKLANEGRGLDLLGPLLNDSGIIVVKADSPFHSLADLKGKKVGTLPAGSGIYSDLKILAAQQGFDFEKDFQHVPGPPPALVGFLQGSQVDAIVVFEPSVSKLEATGQYRVIGSIRDEWKKKHGTAMYSLMLAAKKGWAKDHPVEAKRLQELFSDALDIVAGHPDQIVKFGKGLGLNDEELKLASARMATEYVRGDLEATETGARAVLEEAVKLGIVTKVPSPIITKP